MSASTVDEPTEHISSPLQNGYRFVRKGNVYITKHCRKLTYEAGRKVYVVEDNKGKQQGIRVPQHIYEKVLAMHWETKDARMEAVVKKDQALETKVKMELLKLFPKVPAGEVEPILKHTLKKKSGRVGRNKDMPVKEMVVLAVRAHIRHTHTRYDAMLRGGMDRERARETIHGDVDKIVQAWGGKIRGNSTKSKSVRAKQANPGKVTKNQKSKIKRPTVGETLDREGLRKARPAKVVAPRQLRRRRSLRLEELEDLEASEDLDMLDLD